MKYKYLMYLLLAVLLGACSDDEPKNPASEYPDKTEFERIAKGRTWKADDVKYIDSRGNSFDWCGISGGYTYQPSGFLLRDNDCLFAAYYYMANPRRHTMLWTYDEKTGMLYFYVSSFFNEDNRCYIESISENEIIIRKDFGILHEGFYEYENGIEFDYTGKRDEGSYARCIYHPVAEEDADNYWSQYPVIDGPVYGIPSAGK